MELHDGLLQRHPFRQRLRRHPHVLARRTPASVVAGRRAPRQVAGEAAQAEFAGGHTRLRIPRVHHQRHQAESVAPAATAAPAMNRCMVR